MSLYKFLPPDPKIVIGNKKLRFTRPSGLNDPFELKPYIESIGSEKEIADRFWAQFDIGALFDKAYDQAVKQGKTALTREQFYQFARDRIVEQKFDIEESIQNSLNAFFAMLPRFAKEMREHLYTQLEQVGILSLSTDPVSMHMWTHYAAAHKGYAVEFDEKHPFFNQRVSDKDDLRHLRKVEYVDKLPAYDSLSEMDGTKLFCTKNSAYALEKEWRMVFPLSNASASSTIADELFDFPEKAITGVIFGLKADAGCKVEVLNHLATDPNFSHVRKQQIFMNEKERCLEIRDI